MDFFKKNSGLFVVLFLSFWAVGPFFQPGFFSMHDDTQVVRVYQMQQALADGHFPARWVKDLGYGYGYPLFNFYAPLPYYLGGLVNVVGINALDSTKIMMILGILLSGIFMYFLAKEFWGELGGIASGLFYVYAPYHAVDIYVRGAVGEFWAYAFIPLAFLGFYKLTTQNNNFRWLVIGSIGYAGIILSHNLTAMMVIPLITIVTLLYGFIVYKKKQPYAIRYPLYAIFFGLGLSAFYWLPALLEINYTNIVSQIGGGADFRDHFVCIQQLWDSPWGFGGSIPGCIDGMSFKIGKLHLITTFLALVLGYYLWKKDRLRSLVILSSIFYLLFSISMTLEISKPIWEAISPLAFVQYPWRFLVIISFVAAFLAGAFVWFLHPFRIVSFLGAIILVFLLLYFNLKLFQPQTILQRTADFYISGENIKWTTSKISDEYMPKGFLKLEKKEDIIKEKVRGVDLIIDKTQELSFRVDNKKGETLLVNIAPFPGWRAFIDNNPTDHISKNNGLEILVSEGRHEIKFSFVSTSLEKLANIISLISIFGLISGMLYFRLRL